MKNLVSIIILPALLLIVPLGYSPFFYDPYTVKYLIVNILLVICLLISLRRLIDGEGIELKLNAINIIFISIFALLLMHYVLTPYRYAISIELFQWISIGLIFFVTRAYWTVEKGLKSFYLAWIIGLITVSIWAITQAFLSDKKPNAGIGNPNFLAGYILVAFPIVISSFYVKGILRIFRVVAVLAVLAGSFALYYTRSWSAVVALIVILFIVIAVFIKRSKVRMCLWIFLGAGLIWLIRTDVVMDSIIKQVQYDIRPFVWHGASLMILDHPLFGFGPGTAFIFFPQYRPIAYFTTPLSVNATRHLHNELLELVVEWGLIGSLLIMGLIVGLCAKLIKGLYEGSVPRYFWCLPFSVCILFVQNLFDVNLQFPVSFMILWLLLAVMSTQVKTRSYRIQVTLPKLLRYTVIAMTVGACLLFLIREIRVRGIAQHYLKKGAVARSHEHWDKAIQYYQKALSYDPANIDAWYKLGFYYAMLGKTHEAMMTYKYVGDMAPDFADLNRNLGVLYLEMGMQKEAKECLLRQKKLNPYDIETRATLASIYLQRGEKSNASKEIAALIRLDPNHVFLKQVGMDEKL